MQTDYNCPNCGWRPEEGQEAKERTHCPNCLCRRHETDEEGYECGGLLEPISISVGTNGKWEIILRCRLCGEIHGEERFQEDNPIKLLSVAAKPLASPPFPIERLQQLTDLMGGSGTVGGYKSEQRK